MARVKFQTLTEPMYYILLALTSECCGIDIMHRVDEISHGRISVGPGTLYAMLQKFEDSGVILRTREEGRKKWYEITDTGREMLDAERERLRIMLDDAENFSKLVK